MCHHRNWVRSAEEVATRGRSGRFLVATVASNFRVCRSIHYIPSKP